MSEPPRVLTIGHSTHAADRFYQELGHHLGGRRRPRLDISD